MLKMQSLSHPNLRANMTGMSNTLQNTKLLSNQPKSPMTGSQNTDTSFSSALNSYTHVSAMYTANGAMGFPPTLSERGAVIDTAKGTITVTEPKNNPQQKSMLPIVAPQTNPSIQGKSLEHKPMPLPQHSGGMPLQKKRAIGLNTRAIALDQNSLNTLDRLSKKNENTPPTKTPQEEASVLTSKEITQSLDKISENNAVENTSKNVKTNEDTHIDKNAKNDASNVSSSADNDNTLGKLSAKYESSHKGSSVIGYDRHGGTSYGSYQISSKQGSFDDFLYFLDEHEPTWADKLRQSGDANTGSRTGKTPDMWKELCEQNPERMKELEHDYIVGSYYAPVGSHVENTLGRSISATMQEVLFSTAVQHGVTGAKNLFNKAIAHMNLNINPENSPENNITDQTTALSQEKEIIQNIYSQRKNKFGSSTAAVQESVKNRFIREERDALAMLG